MDDAGMDSRVRELEIKLTFLEKRLEEMEEGAVAHFRKMERLEHELRRLAVVASRLSVDAGGGAGADLPGDEKPPHY